MSTKRTTFSESNINASSNTLSLTITVFFSADNNQTYTYDKVLYCSCNGVQQSRTISLYRGGSVSESFTFDNLVGGSIVSFSWSCNTQTSVLGNVSDSGSYTLSSIPRYASFSECYVSGRTSSSCSVYWNADSSIDYVQYSLNGGAWVDCSGHSVSVYGLASGTDYNIRIRIRRADSGLWTESGYLYFTTFALTSPAIFLYSKSINHIVVSASCNVAVSSTLYRIYNRSTGVWGDYQSSNSFYSLSPNTSYQVEVKMVGSDSGETGYGYVDVVTFDYARVFANDFNHGDDVFVSFSNVSGCEVSLCIVDKLTDSVVCGYRNASGDSYTFVFSDDELDAMYRKFENENSQVVRIYIRTYCNGVYYYDYKDVTVTLTGNQKTIHIYINGLKNAKTFIGYKAQVSRGVWWIGDKDNIPRRCI